MATNFLKRASGEVNLFDGIGVGDDQIVWSNTHNCTVFLMKIMDHVFHLSLVHGIRFPQIR